MGPTSPEVIDGLINAWLTLSPHIDTYGPGVLFVVTVVVTWRALNRAARYVERTRQRAAAGQQLAAERQQLADLSAALDEAPLIPTRPGCDTDALDTCNAIWNADSRKETDQP